MWGFQAERKPRSLILAHIFLPISGCFCQKIEASGCGLLCPTRVWVPRLRTSLSWKTTLLKMTKCKFLLILSVFPARETPSSLKGWAERQLQRGRNHSAFSSPTGQSVGQGFWCQLCPWSVIPGVQEQCLRGRLAIRSLPVVRFSTNCSSVYQMLNLLGARLRDFHKVCWFRTHPARLALLILYPIIQMCYWGSDWITNLPESHCQ